MLTDDKSEIKQKLSRDFADRLNHALDSRPDLVRKNRGRTIDFCTVFQVHYTTGHRLLNGDDLPNALLLIKLQELLGINGMWFLSDASQSQERLPAGVKKFIQH